MPEKDRPVESKDNGGRAGRAFEALLQSAWAITPSYLQLMAEISARAERKPGDVDIDAIMVRRAERLERTESVQMREGVAVLPVVGPMFRRANMFTEISGGTSTENLARDFGAAVADQSVRAIVISVDSPGGQVNGITELAEHIFRAREIKPVIAHVGGLGLSGGYYLASAASMVMASPTAELGSIGVVAMVRRREIGNAIELVSTQSPRKRMDPTSEEGRASLQEVIDDIAAVFVADVARFRGVEPKTVIEEFGRGGVMVGRRAVDAGLADELATLEDAISLASEQGKQQEIFAMNDATKKAAETVATYTGDQITASLIRSQFPAVAEELADSARTEAKSEIEQARVDGAKAERERIQGVLAQGEGLKGHEKLVHRLAFEETETSPEQAAVQILKAERESENQVLARRQASSPSPLDPNASETGDLGSVSADDMSDEGLKRKWEQNSKVREEFMDFDAYAAYERANHAGQVKRLDASKRAN